jgi:hypothetical protein
MSISPYSLLNKVVRCEPPTIVVCAIWIAVYNGHGDTEIGGFETIMIENLAVSAPTSGRFYGARHLVTLANRTQGYMLPDSCPNLVASGQGTD